MAINAYLASLRIALNVQLAGGTPSVPLTANPAPAEALTTQLGNGQGLTNVVYFNSYLTLTPSQTLSLDLLNGSSALLDPFGSILLPIVRVKAFAAWLYNTTYLGTLYNASEVTLGGGSSPWVGPWGAGTKSLWSGAANNDGFCHLYGDMRADATGWVVTPSTAHLLQIVNNDTVNPAMLLLMAAGNLT
jgi:hypothetical protein